MNERSFIVNNLLAHMCDFLIPPSGAARSLFQRRAAAVATALRAVPCGSMLRPATRLRVWLRRARQAGGYKSAHMLFQDFVFNVASTACCDITGTGCTGETKLS